VLRRAGMPARTPATITAPDGFLAELVRVRAQGYAVDDGEEEVGVRCLAVAVRDLGGQVLAAASVSGPAERMEPGRLPGLAAQMRSVLEGLASTLTG
jgi:IclR family acetate operon transcriptional repressor